MMENSATLLVPSEKALDAWLMLREAGVEAQILIKGADMSQIRKAYSHYGSAEIDHLKDSAKFKILIGQSRDESEETADRIVAAIESKRPPQTVSTNMLRSLYWVCFALAILGVLLTTTDYISSHYLHLDTACSGGFC